FGEGLRMFVVVQFVQFRTSAVFILILGKDVNPVHGKSQVVSNADPFLCGLAFLRCDQNYTVSAPASPQGRGGGALQYRKFSDIAGVDILDRVPVVVTSRATLLIGAVGIGILQRYPVHYEQGIVVARDRTHSADTDL